jgi:sec-independent protein translocase protein TatA
MFDVGGGELVLIVLAVLVLFGPERLPEIARMMKKGMAKIRQAQLEFQSQIEEIKDGLDVELDNNATHYQAKPVVIEEFERALEDRHAEEQNIATDVKPEKSPDNAEPAHPQAIPDATPTHKDVF